MDLTRLSSPFSAPCFARRPTRNRAISCTQTNSVPKSYWAKSAPASAPIAFTASVLVRGVQLVIS